MRICKCIEEANTLLAERNSRLVTGVSFKTGLEYPLLQTEVIEKKRGARAVTMIPAYCPFCGKKLPLAKKMGKTS